MPRGHPHCHAGFSLYLSTCGDAYGSAGVGVALVIGAKVGVGASVGVTIVGPGIGVPPTTLPHGSPPQGSYPEQFPQGFGAQSHGEGAQLLTAGWPQLQGLPGCIGAQIAGAWAYAGLGGNVAYGAMAPHGDWLTGAAHKPGPAGQLAHERARRTDRSRSIDRRGAQTGAGAPHRHRILQSSK